MAIPTVTAYLDTENKLWATEAEAIASNDRINMDTIKEDTLIFLKTIPREVYAEFPALNKETIRKILKSFIFHLIDMGYTFDKNP
jgi:hypothetical protein